MLKTVWCHERIGKWFTQAAWLLSQYNLNKLVWNKRKFFMNLYLITCIINLFRFFWHFHYDVDIVFFCRSIYDFSLSAIKISLHMERKYSYYLYNMILPVIILAILGTFVFVLPVESGEKNGYALTILLSMSVVMTIVADSIPPISSETCILSKCAAACFIFSGSFI